MDITKDLTGRLISINFMKCKRFSCGGFSVNMNSPAAIVGLTAQQDQIRAGLIDGRLIDITDQNVNGQDLKGARHTKPVLEDTGEKVYITIGTNGSMSVAIPKDANEQAEFEAKIAEEGILILDSPKLAETSSPLKYGVVSNPSERSQVLNTFNQTISNIRKGHK